VAQFRVEFVLDEASGMYLAELYHPDDVNELVVRTEALYPTQAAAVLGVVQLFKEAVLQVLRPQAKKVAAKKKRVRKATQPKRRRKAAKRRK
jgi:hypothetical protein